MGFLLRKLDGLRSGKSRAANHQRESVCQMTPIFATKSIRTSTYNRVSTITYKARLVAALQSVGRQGGGTNTSMDIIQSRNQEMLTARVSKYRGPHALESTLCSLDHFSKTEANSFTACFSIARISGDTR